MATSCIQDVLEDLLLKINGIHLTYLSEKDPSAKIKYRHCLQKYIHELLCMVPHHQKFNFSETADVLYKSIQKTKSSNLVKLANAWIALAAYANNLYNQPWRKEFHEITTYCGYYKHHIENYLVGAERILKIMGYEQRSDYKLVFNISTDSELICAASQDSIIALTECQVIFAIYKEVSKNVPSCTLTDILEYRQTHVCTVDEAIEGMYCMRYRKKTNCCCRSNCEVCFSNYFHHRYSSSSSSSPSACCFNDRRISPNCCSSKGCPTTVACDRNGYRGDDSCCYPPDCDSVRHAKKACECSVPTGKLINIDGNQQTNRGFVQNPFHNVQQPVVVVGNSSSKYLDLLTGSYNKRDRRYADDKGTSRKERERYGKDVQEQSRSSVRVSEGLHNLRINADESEDKSKREIFDDLVDAGSSAVVNRELNKVSENGSSDGKWECNTCTYHNRQTSPVCEMCGKSRTVGSEAKPLISGGKQCPHCTLVNSKDALICEACSNSLKDSPTYI